jgi:DNA-binding CsgD family transcriptional regulator
MNARRNVRANRRRQPDGRRVSLDTIVQRLYESALTSTPQGYGAQGLGITADVIPADAASFCIWHQGSPQPGTVARWNLPDGWLAGEPVSTWAAAAQILMPRANGGVCVASFDQTHSQLGKTRWHRHGLRNTSMSHGLAGSWRYEDLPLQIIAIYLRRRGEPRFSREDGQALTQLLPHLAGGCVVALRTRVLRDRWLREMDRPSRGGTGLTDSAGALFDADDEFKQMLHEVFPAWSGTHLPFTIPDRIWQQGGEARTGDLRVRVEPMGDFRTLHVRRVLPLDLLSRREREIVRSLVSGLSLKSTARRLNISPSTVANHASHIYAKLGVHGRDKLVELIKNSLRGSTKKG